MAVPLIDILAEEQALPAAELERERRAGEERRKAHDGQAVEPDREKLPAELPGVEWRSDKVGEGAAGEEGDPTDERERREGPGADGGEKGHPFPPM